MGVTIPNLNPYPIVPTGNELAELSGVGGSWKITFAYLAWSRSENTISTGGTTTISASNYGDVVVTTTSAVTINLPLALDRNGVPMIIVGWSNNPNITIVPDGSDTIMGNASLSLTTGYGSFTLKPRLDGWYQI